jgi:hypothetical protein
MVARKPRLGAEMTNDARAGSGRRDARNGGRHIDRIDRQADNAAKGTG